MWSHMCEWLLKHAREGAAAELYVYTASKNV